MPSKTKKEFSLKPFEVATVVPLGTECPRPRSGHRIVCGDDEHLYLFGGYNPLLAPSYIYDGDPTWSLQNPLFRELWTYSIANRSWKLHHDVQNMPEELASSAMCIYGKYILIFGGTGLPFGIKRSNDLTIWDTSNKNKEGSTFVVAETNGQRPPGLYGQCIVCHDDHLYTVGGTEGFDFNCDVYRLNLRTMTWKPLYIGKGLDDPAGRYRHEVVVYDNKLYVLGGGTALQAFDLMDIPAFDLATNTWAFQVTKPDDFFTPPMGPQPRKCHSAVQLPAPNNNQVFVACGFDGSNLFNCVWQLNLKDFQWTQIRSSAMPKQMYFHSSTVTSAGCMYVFGGIQIQGNSIIRNNKMFKIWLCVPKLSEMAWEAVKYYFPHIGKESRQTLIHEGIPVHFVDRISPAAE